MSDVASDDLRTALRVAIATSDGAALVALLGSGWQPDALQSVGDGVAAAGAGALAAASSIRSSGASPR